MTPRPVMTRQELHQLVWSKSLEAGAVDLQMSASGLRKVCLKHNVPFPTAAHWSSNETATPAPLPTHEGSQYVPFNATSRKPAADLAAKREAAKAALIGGPISRKASHPCVQATAKALAAAIPDRRGALTVAGAGLAGVSVSPELVDRSLAVLDAVIRKVESAGYSIVTGSASARLQIDGVQLPFSIAETFSRSDAPPDADELERRRQFQERYPLQVANYGFLNPWMFRPSRKLSVSIGIGPMAGLRAKFTETRLGNLEGRADEIVAEAVAHAAAHRAVRDKIEARRAERRADLDDALHVEQEEGRAKFVGDKAAQLQQVMQLDAFVRHVQAASPPPMSEAGACLRWAKDHLEERRSALGLAGMERAVRTSGLWARPAGRRKGRRDMDLPDE